MKKLFNQYKLKVQNMSMNSAIIHQFKDEWFYGYLVLLMVLAITMVASIYSSYYYFSLNYVAPLIDSPVLLVIISIVLTILIELLTNYVVSYFFKYLYEFKKFVVICFLFVVSGSLYLFSWYNSCEGIELHQRARVDNTVKIKTDYQQLINQSKSAYSARIQDIKNEITTIKKNPAGYNAGDKTPSRLMNYQLSDIKNYNQTIDNLTAQMNLEISKLEQKCNFEKSQNVQLQTKKGNKYYNTIAVLLIAQLICMALVKLYQHISSEKQKPILEKIQQTADELKENCKVLYMDIVKNESEEMNQNMRIAAFANREKITAQKGQNDNEKKEKNGIGFMANKKNDTVASEQKNDTINDEHGISANPKNDKIDSVVAKNDTITENNTVNDEDTKQRICQHCGKPYEFGPKKKKYCSEYCKGKANFIKNNQKGKDFSQFSMFKE